MRRLSLAFGALALLFLATACTSTTGGEEGADPHAPARAVMHQNSIMNISGIRFGGD